MKTYRARIQHLGTGAVYVVLVLASSLAEARAKAVDWPYMSDGYALLEVTA
jgi:hypothetical protein